MAKKISKDIQERRRKKQISSPLVGRNKFEVHLNRSKHNILGKKEKHDRGVPGVSRSKANEKRKKTLLTKYKQRNKSNMLLDKRFGEFDETMSMEEKMLKRFALEKQSHHIKSGHYNIDDEEELTHYGQNLADIKSFDEIELESGDDDDDDGKDDDGVFGGLLTKKKRDTPEDGHGEKKMTKKEILQEMIAESKRDKNEKKKTKELSFELTQKLDKEFNDIHALLIKRADQATAPSTKPDDYDKIVKELIFEAKGTPTERLESAEEIAIKEKNRLEKLERQRKERMELLDEDVEVVHQSADALIPKLSKKKDDRFLLRYEDGKMVMPEGVDDGSLLNSEIVGKQAEGNEPEGEDDEESGDEDNEDDEDESEDESEEETDNEDVFSDEDDITGGPVKEDLIQTPASNDDVADVVKEKVKKGKGKVSIKKPPDFKRVPNSVKELKRAMKKSGLKVSDFLRETFNTNARNKEQLKTLLNVSFEYLDYAVETEESVIQQINSFGSLLQQLAEQLPLQITGIIQTRLKAMFERILSCIKSKKFSDVFPSLAELILLKLIEILFPTSDFLHSITTPALRIICQIFFKARFTDMKCVVSGAFLLHICYNYLKLSKRYLPELILFLSRLLVEAVALDAKFNKITSSVLNMQRTKPGILHLGEKQDTDFCPVNINWISSSSTENATTLNSASVKLSVTRNILSLCEKFFILYKDLETIKELFEPVSCIIKLLPVENYPVALASFQSQLLDQIETKTASEKQPLKLQSKKPIPLPLLEPQFDEDSSQLFRKNSGNKAKNEYDKLKYKVKREMKGAVKEIRKDTQFLAKQQLGEQLEKDSTRKRKVKELKSAIENERRDIKMLEKRKK